MKITNAYYAEVNTKIMVGQSFEINFFWNCPTKLLEAFKFSKNLNFAKKSEYTIIKQNFLKKNYQFRITVFRDILQEGLQLICFKITSNFAFY